MNQSDLVSFVNRNFVTPAALTKPLGMWKYFLVQQTGRTGTLYDLESGWLRLNGAVGSTLRDLWSSFLIANGYSGDEGGLKAYLRNGTYFTSPVTDISWYASYWAEGTQGTPFVADTTAAQWDDNSGNSRHIAQVTAGSRPTYRASVAALNNRPALEFATDILLLDNTGFNIAAAPFSIVVIANWVSPDSSSDNLVGPNVGATALVRKTSSVFNVWTNVVTTIAVDSNVHLMGGVWNGASSKAMYDNQTITGTTTGAAMDGINIGGAGGSASSQTANIAFVGVYIGDITAHVKWASFKNWSVRYGVVV